MKIVFPQLILYSLQLMLLSAVLGPAGCKVDRGPLEAYQRSLIERNYAKTITSRGIKASLIHRDHFSLHSNVSNRGRNPAQGLRRRAERGVTEDGLSNSPVGQPVDWETQVSPSQHSEYLMKISLGTPPQTFVAAVDTGSDLTWLQCSPCQNCYSQSDPLFQPSISATFAKLSCSSAACEFLSTAGKCAYSPSAVEGSDCGYFYNYGGGDNTKGTLARDAINLEAVGGGVQSVPNYWFGCSQDASDNFGFEAADGLVGLGRGNISFPSQLGQYFGNKFSYCLVNRSRRALESSPMIFGDDALSVTTSNGSQLQFQFTPMISNPMSHMGDSYSTFYYVDVEAITVNGAAAPVPKEAFAIARNGSGGFFFDCGTTYSLLVSEALDPLLDAVSSAITDYDREYNVSSLFELCYKAPWQMWENEYGKKVPSLSFIFADNSRFNMGVVNSWVELEDASGVICLAFTRSSSLNFDSNIFGNVQQVDHQLVYDLESRRIGFAPAICEGIP